MLKLWRKPAPEVIDVGVVPIRIILDDGRIVVARCEGGRVGGHSYIDAQARAYRRVQLWNAQRIIDLKNMEIPMASVYTIEYDARQPLYKDRHNQTVNPAQLAAMAH